MIWQPMKATFFALTIALATQTHAQEFGVAAWLERCTDEAAEVQSAQTADGGEMQFSVTSCLTTARRTCQFAENALGCFAQYTKTVGGLIREIRANLPEQAEGESSRDRFLNSMEYCQDSVERDFPIELLHLPVEIRAPVKACEILAPSIELGFLLRVKDRQDTIQSKD